MVILGSALLIVAFLAGSSSVQSASPPNPSAEKQSSCELEAVDGQEVLAYAPAARLSNSVRTEANQRTDVGYLCASYVGRLEQKLTESRDLQLVNRVSELSQAAAVRVRAALSAGNPNLPVLVDFGGMAGRLDSLPTGTLPIGQHIFSMESAQLAAVLFRRGGERVVQLVLADKASNLFCIYKFNRDAGDFNVLVMQQLFIDEKNHPTCTLRVLPTQG